MYEQDGNTVVLKELQNWTHCTIHSCECVESFPVRITEGMNELVVPNLHTGLTYNFEISRQSPGVEDNGYSVAECEVSIPGRVEYTEYLC